MSENYLSELELLLSKNSDYVVEEKLNKNKIAELAHKYDPELIDLLASNKAMRGLFFVETKSNALVFNKDKFIQFINNKEFLPDSFTAYKNKIGLATGNELLSEKKEVVLNWAYKDCVLEGGQDKEDAKRDEVFHNEILAPDQIDRLLDEKVLSGWKRYDKDGEHDVKDIKDDDNLIVRGNNLLALHSLKKRYAGAVKLIYIDPPYNTGNDSFGYNDRFNHSTWLTFMRNRLEVARNLLSSDGTIYVQADYNESHYLKVLMDEVFGRENFLNEIVWHYENKFKFEFTKHFNVDTESLLVYSKKKDGQFFKHVKVPVKVPRKQNKVEWDSVGKKMVTVKDADGNVVYYDSNEKIVGTLWNIPRINSQSKERTGLIGQKPEQLIQRIIEASTNPGDIVLDYHLGSGTTCAVALKMGRRFIGVEQLDYADNDSVDRLRNVIAGDTSGISKVMNWTGGGNFAYCHLMDLGNKFIQKVKNAGTDKELIGLVEQAKKSSFLSYKVDPEKINPGDKNFKDLSIAHKKQLLLELVDQNHLYVNYSEINDRDFGVSTEDKILNKQFYGK